MSILKEFIQENLFKLLDKDIELEVNMLCSVSGYFIFFYQVFYDEPFCKFYFEKDLISINGIDEICNIETFIKLFPKFDESNSFFKKDIFLSYLRDELEKFIIKKR